VVVIIQKYYLLASTTTYRELVGELDRRYSLSFECKSFYGDDWATVLDDNSLYCRCCDETLIYFRSYSHHDCPRCNPSHRDKERFDGPHFQSYLDILHLPYIDDSAEVLPWCSDLSSLSIPFDIVGNGSTS
jgi:hypothetical protein